MAAKLQCPKCDRVLKEEGDECKEARGEYRVFDSLWNSKHTKGKFRVILCLACNQYFNVEEMHKKHGY